MATELIVCPRCGAPPTHPADAQGQYVCGYCGSRYLSRQPPPRAPAPPALPPRSSNLAVALAAVGGIAILAAVGAGVALSRSSTSDRRAPASPSKLAPRLDTLPTAPAEPDVAATATFALESRASGYKTSFYVFGLVTNTSPFVIDKPKVTAVLLDGAGKEVATRDGYAEADSVAPGATVPLKLLVRDPPAHQSLSFEVVVKKASYVPERAERLRLEVTGPPRSTFGKSWEVTGKVFNDGKAAARFVKILVKAFDAQDRLIGLDATYADGQTLAAGASARFRAMPLYDAAPHHFRYELSGQPAK